VILSDDRKYTTSVYGFMKGVTDIAIEATKNCIEYIDSSS
jgi:hypothetical protein